MTALPHARGSVAALATAALAIPFVLLSAPVQADESSGLTVTITPASDTIMEYAATGQGASRCIEVEITDTEAVYGRTYQVTTDPATDGAEFEVTPGGSAGGGSGCSGRSQDFDGDTFTASQRLLVDGSLSDGQTITTTVKAYDHDDLVDPPVTTLVDTATTTATVGLPGHPADWNLSDRDQFTVGETVTITWDGTWAPGTQFIAFVNPAPAGSGSYNGYYPPIVLDEGASPITSFAVPEFYGPDDDVPLAGMTLEVTVMASTSPFNEYNDNWTYAFYQRIPVVAANNTSPDPDPGEQPDPDPDPSGSGDSGSHDHGPDEADLTDGNRGMVDALTTSVERGGKLDVLVGTEYAGDDVHAVFFSTPMPAGTYTVSASGHVTVSVPDTLSRGAHRIAIYDGSGAIIGWDTIRVTGGDVVGDAAAGGPDKLFLMAALVMLIYGVKITSAGTWMLHRVR